MSCFSLSQFNFTTVLQIYLPSQDPLDVSIMIGQDCSEALMPLEVKFGKPEEPNAVRTRLWRDLLGVHDF